MKDVETMLSELTLSDKIALLTGGDFWHTKALPQHGVPGLRMSDGPNGVRGIKFFNGKGASCFPCGTGLAASFDVDLMRRVGEALGDEARAKGVHIILGPTINMVRSPLGGRSFESYSEDPHLSGMIAAAYVNGVESKGVAATPKHYVGNEQEFERFSTDSIIPMRALREIYLEPFRLVMKHTQASPPRCWMTALNPVNGTHASESRFLLEDVLREEWGFKGLIMSDWTGVYSTAESIKAGLDIEMPAPGVYRGNTVNRALQSGKLLPKDVDARARKVLELAKSALERDIPFDAPMESIDTPETRALLRETASNAVVLLKNDAGLLPIEDNVKSIAVIGYNARAAIQSGGGSAALLSTYTVSPLEGIEAIAAERGASVSFATGAAAYRFAPVIERDITAADGTAGTHIEFWKECPVESGDWWTDTQSELAQPYFTAPCTSTLAFCFDGVPYDELGRRPFCRMSFDFVPHATGNWLFGIVTIGYANLYVDGKLIVENVQSYEPGDMFFGLASEEQRGYCQLEQGRRYKIEVRQRTDPTLSRDGPFISRTCIRAGATLDLPEEDMRNEAAELAANSDVAIVVVGTNHDWEGEGFDRAEMKLPGGNDALVTAVIKANPRTVVVTQSGAPVTMPWIEQAQTVMHSYFLGNEGSAIADIIFGKTAPSGKLSMTFPKRLEDNPTYPSFGDTLDSTRQAVYSEGVFVGYRHYERRQIAPLFAFGHGLTYTTFEFSELDISAADAQGSFEISCKVANTGKRDGKVVVQVYSAPGVDTRSSPVKELRAFSKLFIKAGTSATVTSRLEKEFFSSWDVQRDAWVAKPGSYRVLVGESSADITLEGRVDLPARLQWRGL